MKLTDESKVVLAAIVTVLFIAFVAVKDFIN